VDFVSSEKYSGVNKTATAQQLVQFPSITPWMDTKITKDLAFPFIACPAATFFADFVQFQGENHPQAGSGVIFTADSYSFFMEPRPKIFGKVEVGFGGPSMGSYPSILSFPQPRPQAIKRCQWLVTMST